MASWTFLTRQVPPSTNGLAKPLTHTLAQAVRRMENSFHPRQRESARPEEVDPPSHDDDFQLFRRHVGETRPIKGREDRAGPTRRAPRSQSDPPAPAPASREAHEDGFALPPEREIERGTRIEFARPGLQRRELRRLRRGHHAIQDQLDLHGLFASEAECAVLEFIEHSRGRGLRCVRIIHGKGRSSAKGRPVLKAVVDRWLRRCDGVLAFCPAPDNAGGTGAVHVLLRV